MTHGKAKTALARDRRARDVAGAVRNFFCSGRQAIFVTGSDASTLGGTAPSFLQANLDGASSKSCFWRTRPIAIASP